MTSGLKFKINRKLIAAILAIEFSLCFAEAMRAISCHDSGGECWNWFFAFTANIPASIAIEAIRLLLRNAFSIESFKADTALAFTAFFVVGTLWWAIVSHILILFYRHTSRSISNR
jgi:hypothetical protein